MLLNVVGSGSPVLITIHGGGIVNGSRIDPHAPESITCRFTLPQRTDPPAAWPGTWIAADYRLLVPSTAFDIKDDIEALFRYILTLPVDPHQIFLAGFSGGAYPLRLALVHAAEEALRNNPRFSVRGWVSYFGMGGDVLLDYWLSPRDNERQAPLQLDAEELKRERAMWKGKLQHWYDDGKEYSSVPYTPGLENHTPERDDIWTAFHRTGTFNDVLTGHPRLSAQLASLPKAERQRQLPTHLLPLYPQVYLAEHPSRIPPGLLIHGDADPAVPYEESVRTWEDLKSNGRTELVTVRGGDHGLRVNGEVSEEGERADRYALEWMLGLCK